MTILVLTQWRDVTADLVITELNQRGVELVRLDTADFPQRTSMAATIVADGWWSGTIHTPHRQVDLDEVTAVYYRRPAPFELPGAMSDSERNWAGDEARHGFGGVLASLPCRWLNHPSANARAAYKPRQLAIVARCGLSVPQTLITNDPKAASDFVEECRYGAVYKPLHGSPDDIAGWAHFTTPVTAAQAESAGVTATAHLFQERVPKAFEVRLTVVGERMLAARIDTASDAARIDWRSDYDALTFTPIQVPDAVQAGVRGLVHELDLRFGALDFIVTPGGGWMFLEINPNGQWGFIQQRAGLPIAEAIADELTDDNQRQGHGDEHGRHGSPAA